MFRKLLDSRYLIWALLALPSIHHDLGRDFGPARTRGHVRHRDALATLPANSLPGS